MLNQPEELIRKLQQGDQMGFVTVIDLYQNIPTDFIKIKLLNGQDLDLNMHMENFSCFDVSLKV